MNTNLSQMLAVLTMSAITLCAPSGPTLNDLLAFNCPSDQPFKCLPYGACCRGSEFCHSGLCESCFPLDITESALLDWCRDKGQYDVSLMRHSGCRLACQDVFNSTQLAPTLNDSTSVFSYLENSSPPASARKHDVIKDNKIHVTLWITLVVSVCLVLSLLINVCFIRRMWVKCRENNTPVVLKNGIEVKEDDVNASLDLNKDTNSDDASKPLLENKKVDDGKDETVAEQKDTEIDYKDAANKKESRRDTLTDHVQKAVFPGAQSLLAINETLRVDLPEAQRNLKIAETDVDVHSEKHIAHATTFGGDGMNDQLTNIADQDDFREQLPEHDFSKQQGVGGTGARRKKHLPPQDCIIAMNDTHIHAMSNGELRSHEDSLQVHMRRVEDSEASV